MTPQRVGLARRGWMVALAVGVVVLLGLVAAVAFLLGHQDHSAVAGPPVTNTKEVLKEHTVVEKQAPPPVVVGGPNTRVPVPTSSGLVGSWSGQATQHAPKGTDQSVAVATDFNADGSGTHSETIVSSSGTSRCTGTLTPTGQDGSGFTYAYTEQGSDSSCIGHTEVTMTPAGSALVFHETYATSAGNGTLDGTLSH